MQTNMGVGGEGGQAPATGPVGTGPLGGQPRVKKAGVPVEVSEAAAAMGSRTAGKPKTLTEEQREELREHMGRVNELRRERFKVAAGKRVLKRPAGQEEVQVASGTLVRKTTSATGVARPRWTSTTIYSGS